VKLYKVKYSNSFLLVVIFDKLACTHNTKFRMLKKIPLPSYDHITSPNSVVLRHSLVN